MTKRFAKIVFVVPFLTAVLVSCSREAGPPEPEVNALKHTLLAYMVADNNLSSFSYINTSAIYQGMAAADPSATVIVYRDCYGAAPELIEIKKDKKGKVTQTVVGTFPESNSVSIETMQEVFAKVKADYPSDVYGLVLWSHGGGWLPPAKTNILPGTARLQKLQALAAEPLSVEELLSSEVPITHGFGDDYAETISIPDLETALPDDMFDYILFDACYMAGVEVAYQLRNKADYIIASSAEIMGNGFPYASTMKDLFSTPLTEQNRPYRLPETLRKTCESFFNYYNGKIGWEHSATISLINTSELEGLADAVAQIFAHNAPALAQMNTSALQYFDRTPMSPGGHYFYTYSDHYFFDLGEIIGKMDASYYEKNVLFPWQLKLAVPYAAATDWMLLGSGGFKVNHHCGLSTYLCQGRLDVPDAYYRTLDWYQRVYPQ